jgi:hypothetical protein
VVNELTGDITHVDSSDETACLPFSRRMHHRTLLQRSMLDSAVSSSMKLYRRNRLQHNNIRNTEWFTGGCPVIGHRLAQVRAAASSRFLLHFRHDCIACQAAKPAHKRVVSHSFLVPWTLVVQPRAQGYSAARVLGELWWFAGGWDHRRIDSKLVSPMRCQLQCD